MGTVPAEAILAELRSMAIAIQRSPDRRKSIIVDRYESVLAQEGPAAAEYLMLLLNIVNARGDMEERPVINISQAANVNLGSQVGTINAAINELVQRGTEGASVAEAIKSLTEAVTASNVLRGQEKEAVVAVLADVAESARAPTKHKQGMLRALLAGLPAMIAHANDLTALWQKWEPTIRRALGL